MTTADAVRQLKDKFGNAILSQVDFHGETALDVDKNFIKELLAFSKETQGYDVLTDLSGIDYLAPAKYTVVFYLLQNSTNYQRIRLTVSVTRDGVLPSVTSLWTGAEWFERELYDLFGVNFTGHPDLKRILMPDDWVGHPLRRDYALTEEGVAFKHGVQPKIPSQTIPFIPFEKSTNKF